MKFCKRCASNVDDEGGCADCWSEEKDYTIYCTPKGQKPYEVSQSETKAKAISFCDRYNNPTSLLHNPDLHYWFEGSGDE